MTEMTLRTCLLVTDDPDDHVTISEAISQLSEKTVVLIVLDSQRAMFLLQEINTWHPDYIFLDLSMQGIRINSFLKSLRNANGSFKSKNAVVVYGDLNSFTQIDNTEGLVFFSKDYQYSELVDFLRTIFNP